MIKFRDLLQKSRLFMVMFTLCLAFVISSCSSSSSDDDDDDGGNNGGGGNTSEATVTSGNKKEVSSASVEGTKQAILGDDLPLGIDATNTTSETLKTITVDLIEQIENAAALPTGISSSIDGPCGGSADYTSATSGGKISRIDINYRDYCSSDMYLNGLVKIYYSYSGDSISSYKIVYSNVTITGNGYNETINMTIDCNASYSCTYSSTTTGSDGRTYTVSGSTVTGNNSSGYNASATITDPDHGTITITATNITICENGNIGTGEIKVTDSTGNVVLSVTFPNCTQMVVVYKGTSATYNQ